MSTSTIDLESVKIRRMRSSDIEDVQSLFREIDRVHRELIPEEFVDYSGEPRSEHFVSTLLNDGNRRVFLADHQGQVIGMTIGQLIEQSHFKIFRPFRWVLVTDFVVFPQYRQSGVGDKLMKHVESWAKSKEADNIRLTVYNNNEQALDYYSSRGFSPLKQTLEKRL